MDVRDFFCTLWNKKNSEVFMPHYGLYYLGWECYVFFQYGNVLQPIQNNELLNIIRLGKNYFQA